MIGVLEYMKSAPDICGLFDLARFSTHDCDQNDFARLGNDVLMIVIESCDELVRKGKKEFRLGIFDHFLCETISDVQ